MNINNTITALATRQAANTAFDYRGLEPSSVELLERTASEIAVVQLAVRKATAEGVLKIGEALSRVHDALAGHGRDGMFRPWCQQRCGFSEKSARRAIQTYKTFGKKRDTVSLFFEPTAMYLLSAESCPDAATQEALKLVRRTQEIVTAKAARKIIAKYIDAADPEAQATVAEGPCHLPDQIESRRQLIADDNQVDEQAHVGGRAADRRDEGPQHGGDPGHADAHVDSGQEHDHADAGDDHDDGRADCCDLQDFRDEDATDIVDFSADNTKVNVFLLFSRTVARWRTNATLADMRSLAEHLRLIADSLDAPAVAADKPNTQPRTTVHSIEIGAGAQVTAQAAGPCPPGGDHELGNSANCQEPQITEVPTARTDGDAGHAGINSPRLVTIRGKTYEVQEQHGMWMFRMSPEAGWTIASSEFTEIINTQVAQATQGTAPICPNCGCNDVDEDGDCAQCREPGVGRAEA